MAEAWRNELLINHFRTALFSVALIIGGVVTTLMLGRPHAAIFLMVGWLLFIAVFNAPWFKRHFHPAVPWVLSAAEIVVIGLGFALSRPYILSTRPELADTVWMTAATRDAGVALAHELAHVLMDSGEHSDEPGNLMRDETSPTNTALSVTQCTRLRETALSNGLLQR